MSSTWASGATGRPAARAATALMGLQIYSNGTKLADLEVDRGLRFRIRRPTSTTGSRPRGFAMVMLDAGIPRSSSSSRRRSTSTSTTCSSTSWARARRARAARAARTGTAGAGGTAGTAGAGGNGVTSGAGGAGRQRASTGAAGDGSTGGASKRRGRRRVEARRARPKFVGRIVDGHRGRGGHGGHGRRR